MKENAMEIRLEHNAPELVEKLRHSPIEKQRRASLAACEFALARTKVDHPLVEEALQKLHRGERFSFDEKARIERLATELDEQYFELEEASPDEAVGFFEQSRAVASLFYACCEDAFEVFEASTEAIYEAMAACGNRELYTLIYPILEQ